MMRIFLPLIVCLTTVMESEQIKPTHEKIVNTPGREDLISTANHYLKFLNDASFSDAAEIASQVSQLCVPNCKKVLNGKTIFQDRNYYTSQLVDIKKEIGAWKIQPLDVFTSMEDSIVIIRHLVITEKADDLVVLVVLRCNHDGLITEINEVFNKLES